MCFEITSGDIVAVAYFDDERHKDPTGKNASPFSANKETLTAVDEHAETDPGIGAAKTIFVYDFNDPEAGSCYNSFATNAPIEDVYTAEGHGKHLGSDCHEVRKETANDSETEGHSAKAEFTLYNAGLRHCRNSTAEFCALT